VREETLSAFSGSSIHVWVSFALTFDLLARNTPWPANYLSKGLEGIMKKQFITAELNKSLAYLESELGSEDWFNGKAPGRPDVLLSYPVEQIIQRGYVDVDKVYPKVGAWRSRIVNSPAWKRGIEKGNGFDLLNL
jgi:glutathione S-transferase